MTQLNLEATILTNLIYNSDYTRKVIPYIKAEYFQDATQKVVFQTIESYNNTGYEELQKIKRNRRRYSRMCPDLVHFECYSDKKSYVEKLVHKSSTEEEGYIITTLTFPLDKHEIITTVLRSRLY